MKVRRSIQRAKFSSKLCEDAEDSFEVDSEDG